MRIGVVITITNSISDSENMSDNHHGNIKKKNSSDKIVIVTVRTKFGFGRWGLLSRLFGSGMRWWAQLNWVAVKELKPSYHNMICRVWGLDSHNTGI